MNSFPFPIILLVAAVTVGCDESATEPHPDPGPSIPPKVGSTFAYREYDIDSTGLEIAGTSRTIVATVVTTDTSAYNRTGLTLFREADLGYLVQYNAGGDHYFRVVSDDSATARWLTWPFASRKTTFVDVPKDTLPDGRIVTTVEQDMHVGAKWLTTPSGTFNVHEVRAEAIRIYISDSAAAVTTVNTRTWWFAPSIGLPVKVQSQYRVPSERRFNGMERVLVSYALR